jgi:hypothetical protein
MSSLVLDQWRIASLAAIVKPLTRFPSEKAVNLRIIVQKFGLAGAPS